MYVYFYTYGFAFQYVENNIFPAVSGHRPRPGRVKRLENPALRSILGGMGYSLVN